MSDQPPHRIHHRHLHEHLKRLRDHHARIHRGHDERATAEAKRRADQLARQQRTEGSS